MIEKLRLSTTNRPLDVVRYWKGSNGMLLSPPYQRGDVWGPTRRRSLIRSILLGIPIPSIIINDRASAGWDPMISCAVIDGKQRLTTILLFLEDGLHVPGEWFDMRGDILFSHLSLPMQRRFRNHTLGFSEGQLPSLEAEEEVFNLVNFGGVAQGERDSDSPLEDLIQ